MIPKLKTCLIYQMLFQPYDAEFGGAIVSLGYTNDGTI